MILASRGDDGGEYRVESEICDKAGKIAAGQERRAPETARRNEEHERAPSVKVRLTDCGTRHTFDW